MKQKVLLLVSSLLFVIASVVSSSASWFLLYQPKEPKCIKKSG